MLRLMGTARSRVQATSVCADLRGRGFKGDISVLWRGRIGYQPLPGGGYPGYDDTLLDGTVIGASLGSLTGLMTGAGMVALPFLGPISGLGVLGFAAAGLAGGSIAGAFVDHGLSPGDAHYVEHWLNQGRVVVVVECLNKAEVKTARNQFELQGIDNIVLTSGDHDDPWPKNN